MNYGNGKEQRANAPELDNLKGRLQIPEAFELTQKHTSRIHEMVTVLEDRLAPIIDNNPPPKDANSVSSCSSQLVSSKCPLADTIYQNGNSLEHAARRLQNIINNIQL